MAEIEQRFWAKVQKTPRCWLWTAGKSSTGYGQIGCGGCSIRSGKSWSHVEVA